MLKDPEEKKKFFQVCPEQHGGGCLVGFKNAVIGELWSVVLQDVFPTDFGPDYENALQMLMLDFVYRLEKLLPVPDIQQVDELEHHPPSPPITLLNKMCDVYSTEDDKAPI